MALPSITGKTQRRSVLIERAGVDEKARTVTLSFSSETPVARWYGLEILSHDKGAVDLKRLNTRAALLLNHDPDKQIGVVEDATISGGKGRAVVRFGNSALAEEVFRDVKDGIRENVSVGYRADKIEPAAKVNGQEAFRVTRWTPLELSIVSIPADETVGVGRSHEGKNSMPEVTEIEPPQSVAAERSRVKNITAMAKQFRCEDLLEDAIERGISEEVFTRSILDRVPASKPLGECESFGTRKVSEGLWQREASIGMSEQDCESYSFTRAIQSVVANGHASGLEAEASRAAQKLYGREINGIGFVVPLDVLLHQRRQANSYNRTMTTGSATAGGFGVSTDIAVSSFVDLLRKKAVISQLGTRILTGLVGNIVLPKLTGDVTAYWLTETATVTDSDACLGQLILTPKRVAATTKYSKQLVIQSSIDVETLVRSSMAAQIALAWDLAAIAGSNASGEPLGILNTTGLSTSVTFGAAATWAKIVEFETNLAASNADTGAIGWIVSPATRGKWKTIQKVSGQAVFLWENGMVNEYKAYATNQIPTGDKAIFGNFNDLIVGMWGGLDVVIDPYSLATSNQIRVTSQLHCDIGTTRPTSFCISADSAAQ